MSYIKYGGGGIGPKRPTNLGRKRPTLKSGRNNPGRNDPAETTHGRNDSCPKQPTAETTQNRRFSIKNSFFQKLPQML